MSDIEAAARAYLAAHDRQLPAEEWHRAVVDARDALRAALAHAARGEGEADRCPTCDSNTPYIRLDPCVRHEGGDNWHDTSRRAYCERCRIDHPIGAKCLKCGTARPWRCNGMPIVPCRSCGKVPTQIVAMGPTPPPATGEGEVLTPDVPEGTTIAQLAQERRDANRTVWITHDATREDERGVDREAIEAARKEEGK